VRFDHPLARTREYVDIVNLALARKPVEYAGRHWTLPLPDGPGKALRLTVHPVRDHVPVYLASVGPKNLELTGEIADGWLAIFFSPEHGAQSLDAVRAGRRTAGRGSPDDPLAGFDVVPTVPVVIDHNVERAAMPVRPYAALYVGGMGSRQQNFYNALAVRMGYEREAREVQDLFLDRKHRDAAMAVPLSFIDQTSLIGPRDRVRDRLAAYAEAGVTTLNVSTFHGDLESRLTTLRTMAELLDESGLGEGA
jgi:F420-dependent oxidoreductase-like protein